MLDGHGSGGKSRVKLGWQVIHGLGRWVIARQLKWREKAIPIGEGLEAGMPVSVVWGGPRVGNSYKRGEALGCRGRECPQRS